MGTRSDEFKWGVSEELVTPRFVAAATFASDRAEPREWHVPDLVPARTVTMLGGDGGTGRSLLAMHLAVSTALGSSWLGRSVRRGGAVYLSAEEEIEELHRRLDEILRSEGRPFDRLHGLKVTSLVGEDALLANIDRDTGLLQPTRLFEELDDFVETQRPALVVLDTLADRFPGDENNRSHARQFIKLLAGLAVRHGCAVLLLAHPSLSGMARGSGLSGSTGWNGSVRSRLFLERTATGGREHEDQNARRLTVKK